MPAAVPTAAMEEAVVETKRSGWLAAVLMGWCAGAAHAVEPDVLLQIQARKNEATPLCAEVLPRSQGLNLQQRYYKALCLLYGLQTAPRTDDAMDLLRAVATEGHPEAQLALADTLQQGTPLQQQEALQWYGRASAGGDIRATLRLARLQQRLQPPMPEPDPEDANAARQPGYHCHIYGFGKKVCHGGMD